MLVAPLDWGLGHATRCIPIIHSLVSSDCHVTLAASGLQANLLQAEFPHLSILPLPGYGIRYGKFLGWKLISQLPQMHKRIRIEKMASGIRGQIRYRCSN